MPWERKSVQEREDHMAHEQHADLVSQLSHQIQHEKSSHDLTRKKLDYYSEEKALTSKEISNLKFQIETLEKQNAYLTLTLEQNNQNKTKAVSEFTKIQSQLDQEKKILNSELEKEKQGQLELTIETSQLKSRLDQAHKLHSTLTSELAVLRTQSEKDKAARAQLETDNSKFREGWVEMQQQLESEKSTKLALAREIQELRKQLKQQESVQNAFMDLTTKAEILEARLRDEQGKRAEMDRIYQDLLQRFEELDRKRANFDNLGVFSDKLIQSVPTFTAHVTEISEKLSEHVNVLKQESTQRDSIKALLAEFQENTQRELRKQSELIELVINSQLKQTDSPRDICTGESQPDYEENAKAEAEAVQEASANESIVDKTEVGESIDQGPVILESNVREPSTTPDDISVSSQ